jgi:hypothetical protein
MSSDPFGNPAPRPELPPGVRTIRLIGIAEVIVGFLLLIVGFAVSASIVALIGGVLVASSGSLFVVARQIARRG